MDIVSYLLAKKGGNGGGGSSVGWTNQNIDQREAVFKSLPEEILVDMNTMVDDYVKIMSSLCHLVRVPTGENRWCYTGGITLHKYDTDNYMCFTTVGRLSIGVMTDGATPKVVDVTVSGFESHDNDNVGTCYDSNYSFALDNLNIVAYKGTPVEIPLITFTINDTEYNAIEGMTWGEWCPSEYSNFMFSYDSETEMVYDESGYFVLNSDGSQVRYYENIVEGTAYQVNYD